MKLSDLKRFAVETAPVPGNSGRTATKVSVLGEEFHAQSGRQSQKHSITLSGRGESEKASVEKALERTLAFLESVQDKAFAVRGGIVSMSYDPKSEVYTANAQLALLDEGDDFTHPVIKSVSSIFADKNPDTAESEALKTVLELMGEL